MINNLDIANDVLTHLSGMRTSKLKAGASREDIKDIETLEKAVWDTIDLSGKCGGCDGQTRATCAEGHPESDCVGKGQNALFKNPNGQLPTGDPEIDSALGFGGDR